jgi:hypothetical protein
VSLQGSKACPAFGSASIDTSQSANLYVKLHDRTCQVNTNSVEYSPFLQYVSDTESFDDNLKSYISTTYNQRQSV